MHRTPQLPFLSFAYRTFLGIVVLVTPYYPVRAADLLRRNSSTSTSASSAGTATGATSGTSAATGTLNTKDSLRRASVAISAVAAMQAAAATAAKTTALQSLPKSTLSPAPELLWNGAALPTTNGSTTTVVQTAQQAYLAWKKFDLTYGDTLNFDQSAGGANVNNWIVFNYVRDPAAKPSQIFGTINTLGPNNAIGGQVYILNANGILFGGTAQVNTHALVASSLPINPTLLQRGLLVQSKGDVQFLFDSIKTSSYDPSVAVADYSTAQTPIVSSDTGTNKYGDIIVQPGAVLTAYDDTAIHVGGRIALIGANVTNAGSIVTNDGQAILAAGLQVGLVAHKSTDPTLRGLDVFVGAVDATSGVVTNNGSTDDPVPFLTSSDISYTNKPYGISGTIVAGTPYSGYIEAQRGNVYITGKAVNQNGAIASSTSVSYNGRIDLVAGHNAVANVGSYDPASINNSDISLQQFVYQTSTATVANSGAVNLGAGSVMQILPEDSADRVVGDLTLPSQVNIQGASVHFNAGSILLAPGAVAPLATLTYVDGVALQTAHPAYSADGLTLEAGVTIRAGSWNTGTSSQFLHTDDAQQIFLEKSATIDVSGSQVQAPVTENIISVELRGTELANSPLQRDGALRGQTVQVDLRQHGVWDATLNGGAGGYTWIGTPLADTSGWVGLTTHTAEELTTNGGSVALKAGGAVVVQSGATIDVSGGSINYTGGYVQTTKVISAGHIYDISQATPDRVYDGVYTGVSTTTDAKWGITTTTVNPLAHLGAYDSGYTQGGNGGSLAITAPVLALDGTLRGNTVADFRQRTLSPIYDPSSPPNPANPAAAGVSNWLLTAFNLPVPSQLSITVGRQWISPVDDNPRSTSPTPANIIFSDSSIYTTQSDPTKPNSTTPVFGDASFAKNRNYELDLSPSLFAVSDSDFGILSVDNSGDNVGVISDDNGIVVGNVQNAGSLKWGTITLPANPSSHTSAMLVMPTGGAIKLSAANINLGAGNVINVAGGNVTLKAYDVSSSVVENLSSYATTIPLAAVPTYNPDRGNIIVGVGAKIIAAGGVAYDSTSDALVTKGGAIALTGNSIALGSGSLLDVSGGASVAANGKITYSDAGGSGNKGGITLQSGQAIGAGYLVGGRLQLDGTFQGYSGLGKAGGSLSITAPAISIESSSATGLGGTELIGTELQTGKLLIAEEFFSQGGFTNFSLNALGLTVDSYGVWDGTVPMYSLAVEPGTTIAPQVWNWGGIGAGNLLYVEKTLADVHLRQPVSLSFSAQGRLKDYLGAVSVMPNATGLSLGYGSLLTTDDTGGTGGAYAFKPGSITLTAGMGGTLDILGTIAAPGGTITLSQDQSSDRGLNSGFKPTIHLASSSTLDASGVALWAYDNSHSVPADKTERGFVRVDVSDGGTILVDGNIVAEGKGLVLDGSGKQVLVNGHSVSRDGAQLNVSGATGTVWQTPGDAAASASLSSGAKLVSVAKDSNGGKLTLVGEQMLFTQATLVGNRGGANAQGGDLVIVSNRYNRNESTTENSFSALVDDPVLTLASSNPVFAFNGLGKSVDTGNTVVLDTKKQLGQIVFGADSFATGGFDGLTLSVKGPNLSDAVAGAVQVQGLVELSAERQIAIADGGVLSFAADSSLTLSAPYVKVGRDFLKPAETTTLNATPSNGSGELKVNASTLIDVGNLVVEGAGRVSLDATYGTTIKRSGITNGSIRGDGSLEVAGDIILTAGQIYPPSGVTFNIVAYDYTASNITKSGEVTINASALDKLGQYPSLPLSAGGKLSIYASTIDQGGVLRAPFGSIALGAATSDGKTSTVLDPLSSSGKQYVPVTTNLILEPGSLTSISAVDATTALTVPYGIDVNGDTWIAPNGVDITNQGLGSSKSGSTAQSIRLNVASAADSNTINIEDGATIDLTGGGDLMAYRFVSGVGGTKDILGDLTSGAFAVLPGYGDTFAPFAPYALGTDATAALGSDMGYVFNTNSKYPVYSLGDRIYLAGGAGLAAGYYTILPARYALLAGAFLVTPKSSSMTVGAATTNTTPEGASLVTGYLIEGFDAAGSVQPLFKTYEVASQAVVNKRAEYDLSQGDAFFTAAATKLGTVTPRVPADAGQLILAAQNQLLLNGTVKTNADITHSGRTGLVDISSSQNIYIGTEKDTLPQTDDNALLLYSDQLSGLGSLLIGGTRETGNKSTDINVSTSTLLVESDAVINNNSDLILVSKGNLTIDGNVTGGAQIKAATDSNFVAESLNVFGECALVRVSSDTTATISRSGNSTTSTTNLAVNKNAALSGAGVILDSSADLKISDGVKIGGSTANVSLSSSQISLGTSPAATTHGLDLDNSLITQLSQSAGLSLLSYGAINFYTAPATTLSFGSMDTLGKLELHSSALNNVGGGSVNLAAKSILIDNVAASTLPSNLATTNGGQLEFDANTIRLGVGKVEADNFAKVALNAKANLILEGKDTGTGTADDPVVHAIFRANGSDLIVQTPLVIAAANANQTLAADGKLTLQSSANSLPSTVSPGMAANLKLTGESVSIDSMAIKLPSGTLTLEATGTTAADSLVVGSNATLDVGGVDKSFFNVSKSTDGGTINLASDNGNVSVGGTVNVSQFLDDSSAWVGDAGTLKISAPNGVFSASTDAKLRGVAGTGYLGGKFSLDVASVRDTTGNTGNLTALHDLLNAGGFAQSVSIRVRKDTSVTIGGTLQTHNYSLSADSGDITVNGAIDASNLIKDPTQLPSQTTVLAENLTGGTISLAAKGNVNLANGAWLTATGYCFDNAGKGGSISLSAGSYVNGAVDGAAKVILNPGSRIDLGVAHAFTIEDVVSAGNYSPTSSTLSGLPADGSGVGGTLHLRESQVALLNDPTQFDGYTSRINGASSVVLEGFQVYDLSANDGASPTKVGAITRRGSGGIIDGVVEQTIKADGTAFANGVSSSSLRNNSLFHFQPGAEIVDSSTGTATYQIVTLNTSSTSLTAGSSIGVSVPKGTAAVPGAVELAIPGGIFSGDTIKVSLQGSTSTTGILFKVNFTDGSSTTVSSGVLQYATSASDTKVIKSITLQNTTSSSKNEVLTFSAGSVPIAVVVPSTQVVTTSKATTLTGSVGDLTLVNTWDLSSYRFNGEPGILTLRAKNNLVFAFDASLSDGFNTTQTVDAIDPTKAVNASYPLWTATLKSDRSWSYRLVAGADYTAADTRQVQPLTKFIATDGAGSVLVGQGASALPTTGTLSRSVIVPQFYQTIRTGTGDIDVFAGRDVKLLNPLATIYTAGSAAPVISNFDLPVLNITSISTGTIDKNYLPFYSAQYAQSGGNVTISAQNNIERLGLNGSLDSAKEMPTNWLYRRGNVDTNGYFAALSGSPSSEIQSTSWWVDYSNFFDDVGALGGGNVTLMAGNDVMNVNASVPTNARVTKQTVTGDKLAANQKLYEFGGGDLFVQAGNDINGGVYYTERGDATLRAGRDVTSNSTRAVTSDATIGDTSPNLLPTTLFLGKGRADVVAGRNLWLGPVANPFLCYQGFNNRIYETTYFSTFDPTDTVSVASLGGKVTLQVSSADSDNGGSLMSWFDKISAGSVGDTQPWLNLSLQTNGALMRSDASIVTSLLPGTLRVTAFAGDIDVVGSLTLTPAAKGTVDLLASGNINGVSANGVNGTNLAWDSSAINLSDATGLPSIAAPLSISTYINSSSSAVLDDLDAHLLAVIAGRMSESGSTKLTLPQKILLHDPSLLHANDTSPMHLYATGGDLSGLTLYSAKAARVAASEDITDIALYVQNVRSDDTTLVTAGRDIIAYDPNSVLRRAAQQPGNVLSFTLGSVGPIFDSTTATTKPGPNPNAGDIQIAGPGTLEVLAGRDLTLGVLTGDSKNFPKDGTAVGITSVGAARNPYLPLNDGASIVADAGIRKSTTTSSSTTTFTPGLASADFTFDNFISSFLTPNTENGDRYLPVLGELMGDTATDSETILSDFKKYYVKSALSEKQAIWVMQVFYRVLGDSGFDYNNSDSSNYRTYTQGLAAIKALLPGSLLPGSAAGATSVWQGNISMPTKLIKTFEGGAVSMLAPGGQILVGRPTDPQTSDQGILTQYGGAISIFASRNVDVGTSRIFTLRGGDETIWSTLGNIAAGSGSKTVYSAPPTRVLIDPQSADVKNDLGGLATGSGIGVLATLAGVQTGNVNLIAPSGTVDAGDAGIRSSGKVNVSAVTIVNGANIQSSAGTTGTPVVAVANVSGLTTASAASAGASSTAGETARQQQRNAAQQQEDALPSIIQVEVLGYGGGDGDDTAKKKDEAGNG